MLLQKNITGIFILLMLFSFNINKSYSQQLRTADLSANLNPVEPDQRNILADREQWKEVESERKVYSSTYRTPDNRIIIHYSAAPVNYYKNGVLVPINTIPAQTENGLTAANQPNQINVSTTGAITIATGAKTNIVYSGNSKINGLQIKSTALQQDDGIYVMKDILPGIDKTFEFRFNSIKYNYVLETPVASTSSDFVIEEEMTLPAGAVIQPDNKFGHKDKRGWLGALSIVAADGKEIGTMRGALCYDANKKSCTAAYKIESENGKQKIKIIIPNEWINSNMRAYPITIDPLVTGPTTTWGGSYIGSCIAPADEADSIMVTIPAQVSVTGCFVSGSYYADPFTTAVMSEGSMFFSTSCNHSTTFTITGATGGSPGTAYLTAYDLHSPLLCCYPQSCTAQTFYLLMHISRTGPGTGCNTTYIYHDPYTGYPFSAYVEGHTVEGYGPLWNVTPNTICSNSCNLTGTVYIRYGVPPFTITHPWMIGSVTAGTPAGCSIANVAKAINLTIPGCPAFCDTASTLSVPPPVVTDACGNVVSGLPPKVITLKEAPTVTATPNSTTICSGIPFNLNLSSCAATSVINWSGNGGSGTGSAITNTIVNSGTAVSATTYSVSAVNNGCLSDTIHVTVNTDPLPVADFSATPQPVIINTPAIFTDNTSVYGGTISSWFWDMGDGTFATTQSPAHAYSIPGTYHVCLNMQTSDGCVDTVCHDVTVIPAQIVLPNVFTPNGDDKNEFLYFKYLEFFGTNNLKVYDRWGKIVYEKDNYENNWNGGKVTDGTYYYVLTLENGKTYPGFVQIIKD